MNVNFYIINEEPRKSIIHQLSKGPKTPSQMIDSISGIPNLQDLSYHLRVLKDNKLVYFRKDGKNRIYHLNVDNLNKILQNVFVGFTTGLDQIKSDIENQQQDDSHITDKTKSNSSDGENLP